MKKRIANLVVAAVMLIGSFNLAASAAIQRRYIPCDNCGIGRIIETGTSTTQWHDAGVIGFCFHGGTSRVNDIYMGRTITTSYHCTNCSSGYDHTYEEIASYCPFLGTFF